MAGEHCTEPQFHQIFRQRTLLPGPAFSSDAFQILKYHFFINMHEHMTHVFNPINHESFFLRKYISE
ncbi:Phospho-N-acetylmuramoyl-pentapeptide-transferase-like protein [Zea mays]|uniref:Phospho-N-acetylmuramoyl-pentapeptide-transferase-like protein n=1 Tax=Zea mays TaxID=4577 RepID=A0A1D6MG54_MAIZE|nr:Phospho-N-acetylmuramoyl-pentapeptide-transferase-like protein [Zea mays]